LNVLDLLLRDPAARVLRDHGGFLDIGAGQKDAEFLSPIPADGIRDT
jgi:hypothetical protein